MGAHYEAFIKAVDSGLFDNLPQADSLKHMKADAQYVLYPYEDDPLFKALVLGEEENPVRGDVSFIAEENYRYVSAFIKGALPNGHILPLEHLVCVEDGFSAVFIRNSQEEEFALEAVTYSYNLIEDNSTYNRLLCGGVVKFNNGMLNSFYPHDVYGIYVKRERTEAVPEEKHPRVGTLLTMCSVNALAHLAYMHNRGEYGVQRPLFNQSFL